MDVTLTLTKAEIAKYFDLLFKKAANELDGIFWCPTPNCEYAFQILPGGTRLFVCPNCTKSYCLDCKY